MPDVEIISKPERIRALAHPIRLALLDHLELVDDATATQCAAAVGESVASCSFHLHILAKYDFIEPAPRRGRERPWRSTVADSLDVRPSESIPGSRRAVAELAAIQVQRQADRLRAFLATMPSEAEEWVQASTVTTSTFWATAEEMSAFSKHLQNAAAEWFGGREADPSMRPAGSRRSHLFAGVNPEPLAASGPAS
ncbi:MAG TPA: helix-turn-helix domain-containing protein [Reyranella sp.]